MKTLRLILSLAIGLLAGRSLAYGATPAPPQNLQQAWLGFETLLYWDEAPGATGYHVYRADAANPSWTQVATNVTLPLWRDGLLAQLPSHYIVSAVNADGEGAPSGPVTVDVAPSWTIAVDPISPALGNATPTNALVRWTTSNPAGEQGLVEWGPDGPGGTNFGFWQFNPNPLPLQSFLLPDLAPATLYHFRVTSLNAQHGGTSVTGSFTTPNTNAPPWAADQSVSTADETPAGFTLLAGDPDGTPLTYTLLTGPAHGTLDGTPPHLTYTPAPGFFGLDALQYSVSDGLETRSATVTFSVAVDRLPPVEGLRRRTYLDGVVRLWWTPLPGAQHYNVYRADGTNAPFLLLATGVAGTNFNDTTALWQQSHWYRLRAWDGTNEGRLSAAVYAYPDASGVLTLDTELWRIHSTTGMVQFHSSILGGTEGLFEYGTNRQYGVSLENTNIQPFQRFALSNLTPATIYYFRVTATDANGNATVASTNLFQDWFATETWPLANPQSVSLSEDTAVAITLTRIDLNYIFHPITFAIATPPAHGTLTPVNADTWRYLPHTNYHGPDSFTFEVSNGELVSTPATVSLTVHPVNDPPVVSPVSFSTAEDTPALHPGAVSDLEGNPTFLLIESQPAHGIASVSGGNLLYRPATNFAGADTFTYRAHDGLNLGNVATVTVTVTPVNDPPLAGALSATTPEDTSIALTLTGSDVEGAPLTFTILAPPAHGTLSNPGSNPTYTPAPGYFGPDSFTYTVNDGSLDSLPGSVALTVTPVNDPPVAHAQSVSTAEDAPLSITLTGADEDGDPLTFILESPGPANGTLSGSPPNLVYTPNPNFHGTDAIEFKVNDGSLDSPVVGISIVVTPVNDPPVAAAQSVSTAYNTPVSITLTGTDIEGAALNFTTVTSPANGTLAGTGANRSFTPNLGWSGTTSFNFKVNDGALDSVAATVTITVAAPAAVPPAPTSLTATAVSRTQINLAWTHNSPAEDGFRIERSTSATSGWTQIATVGPNVTTYSSTGLSRNTTYYYRVRAYNALGNSAYSNTASAKTLK